MQDMGEPFGTGSRASTEPAPQSPPSASIPLAESEVNELASDFRYLDMLRESGVTNMFGAGAYLQRDLGLSRGDAHDVLRMWMSSFAPDVNPVERARTALARADRSEQRSA